MELSLDELEFYMINCIYIAKNCKGRMGRPWVGAVVLDKDSEVRGRGYKSMVKNTSMAFHAERMAIDRAGKYCNGGTLVTTLKPCVKVKKHQIFKSCSELIVESGIVQVVYGYRDDSPSMHDKSCEGYLRSNGVKVVYFNSLQERIRDELMINPKFANREILIELNRSR